MLYFASAVHIVLCIFMIFVILLQPGKDAGMGAAFGGGAATSAFGGRGAVTFLGKVTAVCAIGFFITSLGLSFVGLRKSVASGVSVVNTTNPLNPEKDPKAAAAKAKEDAAKTGAPSGTPAEGVQQQDPTKAAAPAAPGTTSDKKSDGTEGVPAEKPAETK